MILGLISAFAFNAQGSPPTIAELDALAQRRDVEGLTRLISPLGAGIRNPFRVLRTGGAYEVGHLGWHAEALQGADGRDQFVVIWTPLTVEDVGEIVLRRSGTSLTFVPESDPLGGRIVRHRFDVRFDVPKKQAFLVDRMKLRYNAGAPESILVRMSPCYLVRSIEDEQGQAVPFRETGGVVSMQRQNAPDQEVTIRYDAIVDLPNYGGSISPLEATLVNDYWYPTIARGPAPYEVTIHAPRDWTSVAQGERLSDTQTATERVTKYRMDLPVTYYSLISAPFRTVLRSIGGRTFTTYSARMTEEEMIAQDELYATIFNYYSTIFGPPPYPLYGAVDSQTYGGGALEAYTFATWGGRALPAEDAHEPSHTWWGGIVDNTYLNSFWNESFADFTDGLYHRTVPIGSAAERRLAFIEDGASNQEFARAAMSESGADIGGVGSTLGYGKGAKVLQMLEQAIGTDRMIAAMRTWATTQPKGVPGNWNDFERIVARLVPAFDTKGFFDDWVMRPGFADFDAEAKWADGFVNIRLKWNGPRFRMPLTVMLQSAEGAQDFRTVYLDGKSDELRLPAATKPALVSVDPWRQAVRPVSANEEPTELVNAIREMRVVVDPAHRDWRPRGGSVAGSIPDPKGLFIVGSPETLPDMRPLCEKVGFIVQDNQLTYDGTTIDLRHGSATAVVDFGAGKRCVISLGKTRVAPGFGRARLVVTDDLGRFLRGITEPKTAGKLTYRL